LILVVDDEPDLLDLTSSFLDELGFDCVLARSGADGITLLKAHAVAAIVTDVNMPGMSGLDLLRAVRQLSAIPVVVVTADASVTGARVAALGGSALIAKPFFLASLGKFLLDVCGDVPTPAASAK
jgi:CheY-like chemotaxis protein